MAIGIATYLHHIDGALLETGIFGMRDGIDF
jgi:hypothetical protein